MNLARYKMSIFDLFKTKVKETQKTESVTGPSAEEKKAELIRAKKQDFICALGDLAFNFIGDSDIYPSDYWTEKYAKKLDNANESYGHHTEGQHFLLVDTTTFGKADNGFIITSHGIALCEAHEDEGKFISYNQMNKIQGTDSGVTINNRKYEFYATNTINKLRPVFTLINKNLELYN
jgi:hypothetical protein